MGSIGGYLSVSPLIIVAECRGGDTDIMDFILCQNEIYQMNSHRIQVCKDQHR